VKNNGELFIAISVIESQAAKNADAGNE